MNGNRTRIGKGRYLHRWWQLNKLSFCRLGLSNIFPDFSQPIIICMPADISFFTEFRYAYARFLAFFNYALPLCHADFCSYFQYILCQKNTSILKFSRNSETFGKTLICWCYYLTRIEWLEYALSFDAYRGLVTTVIWPIYLQTSRIWILKYILNYWKSSCLGMTKSRRTANNIWTWSVLVRFSSYMGYTGWFFRLHTKRIHSHCG